MEADEQVYNYELKEFKVPLPPEKEVVIEVVIDYVKKARELEAESNKYKKLAFEQSKLEKNLLAINKEDYSKKLNIIFIVVCINLLMNFLIIYLLK